MLRISRSSFRRACNAVIAKTSFGEKYFRGKIAHREDLHSFWKQPSPKGNDPKGYLEQTARSAALLKIIDQPKDARILEVGCNVGRNLAHLYDAGYTNVEGIEISETAVELLRETYPQLADSNIHVGAAEDILPTLDEYDLIFTMAVLEHIHPDSTVVFDNIARLGETVIAVEPHDYHSTNRSYPHDIRELFTSRGMNCFRIEPMAESGLDRYSAYCFKS